MVEITFNGGTVYVSRDDFAMLLDFAETEDNSLDAVINDCSVLIGEGIRYDCSD